MSEHELENYIALVGSLLRLGKSQREEIGNELRDHLQTRVDALKDAGYSAEESVRKALAEFGDAAGLAVDFVSVVQQQRRRWMMRFTTFSVVGVFFVIVLATAMWPEQARFGGPGKGNAQDPTADSNPFDRKTQDADPFAGGPSKKESTRSKNEIIKAAIFESQRIRNDKTEAALDMETSLDFTDSEFSNAKAEIEDRHQITIYVHASAVDAGLGPDDLVTLQFNRIRLRTALEVFLEKYDCSFVVKDGMLVFASSSDCPLAVRTFDASRVLELMSSKNARAKRGGGRFGAPSAGGGSIAAGAGVGGDFAVGGGGGASGGIAANVAASKSSIEPQTKHDLIELFKTMVSPDSWDAGTKKKMINGGDSDIEKNVMANMLNTGRGQIQFAGQVLVVRQRGPELYQVGQLLDDLESRLKQVTSK